MAMYKSSIRNARNLMMKPLELNKYICSLCSAVVWEPECCEFCMKIFCKECISAYNAKNGKCLCGNVYISLEGFEMPVNLNACRFICPKCKGVVPYLETEDHMEACGYVPE